MCPGERKVNCSGRRQHRVKGDGQKQGSTRTPATPREVRVLEGLKSALRPPQAGNIPSARSPASRQALGPWTPWAGLGALSMAGPGMLLRAGWTPRSSCRGSAGDRSRAARLEATGCRHRVCGREVPTVAEGAKYVFQTFHGSKLSASIKRSGGGGGWGW